MSTPVGGISQQTWSQLTPQQQAMFTAQDGMANQSLQNSLANLAMQKKIQEQAEAISTASNLQKARHDMAKSVIDNMRV